MADPARRITALTLQYTNIFEYTKESVDYDIDSLLRADCPHLPRTALTHGPLWHSHHGWFTCDGVPEGTRLLQRMHINGVQDQSDGYVIKMESLLRLDLLTDAVQLPITEGSLKEIIEGRFDFLHHQSKTFLSEYLTSDMANRISLHAS